MQVRQRPDLAEAFKRAASLPNPERYNLSQSDLEYCPGKSCGKEWPDSPYPFNAMLGRGLNAESHWRQFFPEIGFPVEEPDKVTLDGIEGHADSLNAIAVLEFKTTDFNDTSAAIPPHQVWQAKSYCKMYERNLVVFVTVFNKANGGKGEIVIQELEFSDEELDKHWLEVLGRRQLVDDARAWARSTGGKPQVIPAEYRKPHYDWECFNRKGQPNCWFAGWICPGIKK